jgi:hypothetical protein
MEIFLNGLLLFCSRVTHAGIAVDEFEGLLRATVQVFYHYCELEPVGEIIDGDLVVQGMSIRDNFGPAFCVIEHAAGMGDEYTEIGVVAPWSFMLTPSEGDATAGDVAHKAAQFMIPVSIPLGYEFGIVRLQIYVDELSKIPYDEEPINESGECTYDMTSAEKRSSAVSAVSIVKHLTDTGVAGAPGPETTAAEAEVVKGSRRGSEKSSSSANVHGDAGSAAGSTRGGNTAVAGEEDPEVTSILVGENGDTFDAEKAPSRPHTRPQTPSTYAADALLLEQTKGVITDIRIASDYDDVLALQSEGYELHCTAVTPEGPTGEQEHLWKFHVMATYGNPRVIVVVVVSCFSRKFVRAVRYVAAGEAAVFCDCVISDLDPTPPPVYQLAHLTRTSLTPTGNGTETTGLEDVAWVKCLKSLGTLPIVPLFQILHDYDLSDEEDDVSPAYCAADSAILWRLWVAAVSCCVSRGGRSGLSPAHRRKLVRIIQTCL